MSTRTTWPRIQGCLHDPQALTAAVRRLQVAVQAMADRSEGVRA